VTFASALYTGEVMHARADAHARNAFRYRVYTAAIDPRELPALDRELRLFSYNGRNLFALRDRDYTTDLRALGDRVRVVTNLRAFGYVFNPVSFVLAYGPRGELSSVIAEVNNTYGGNFRYTLDDAQRLPETRRGAIGFRCARDFFVSPLLHGAMTYDFWFDAPLDGERIAIAMHVRDRDGRRVLAARLVAAKRTPLSDRALVAAALRYPFMTARVIGAIHYEALKLRARGVPYRRPGPDHRPLDGYC
jgi:DUF1365 family protein